MLEGADHGDNAFALPVAAVDVAEVRVDQDVAVGEEERLVQLAFEQAEPAAGAQRFLLVDILHLIVLFQVVEIGLDHVLFVVDHQIEFAAAEIPEPVDDMLDDGQFPHRDQGLGQDLGVGVEPGAQPPGHDDHRQPGGLAVVDIKAAGKHDVQNMALFVQQRQRVDALFLQHRFGAAPFGHRQADGPVVGRAADRALQRPRAQDVLAHVPVGEHRLQTALGGHEQDALAGFVQLFHRLQHGGVGLDIQFLDMQHGLPPLRARGPRFYSASSASMTR